MSAHRPLLTTRITGRVTLSTEQQLRAAIAILVGLAVIGGGSSAMRSEAAWSLDLPVNPVAVTLGLFMLLTYAVFIGLKPHHVIIWGMLLVAGAVPVWNGPEPSNIGLVMTESP